MKTPECISYIWVLQIGAESLQCSLVINKEIHSPNINLDMVGPSALDHLQMEGSNSFPPSTDHSGILALNISLCECAVTLTRCCAFWFQLRYHVIISVTSLHGSQKEPANSNSIRCRASLSLSQVSQPAAAQLLLKHLSMNILFPSLPSDPL